jgi:hypothetical protein
MSSLTVRTTTMMAEANEGWNVPGADSLVSLPRIGPSHLAHERIIAGRIGGEQTCTQEGASRSPHYLCAT